MSNSQPIFHMKQSLQEDFNAAYSSFPTIPIGILESVSYTKTHCKHIEPTKEQKSCIGLPTYNGIMGLTDNTNGYFKNTLKAILINNIIELYSFGNTRFVLFIRQLMQCNAVGIFLQNKACGRRINANNIQTSTQ